MSSSEEEPRNFLERFDETLLRNNLKKAVYDEAKLLGKTTGAAVPPQILLYTSAKGYLSKAKRTLEEDQKIAKKKNKLEMKNFPSTTNDLRSEANVCLASQFHLFEPIGTVLNIMYPKEKWQILYEYYIPQPDSRKLLKFKSEDIISDAAQHAIRLDQVYVTTEKHEQGAEKIIAVVEFKRRGLIDYENFSPAILPGNSSKETIENKKRAAESESETLLESNGTTFCKQVSAYAEKTGCKHVALFNWDHLLLFEFHNLHLKEDATRAFTAGRVAKLSWVHEETSSSVDDGYLEHGQGLTFRLVVLGWLLHAFEEFEQGEE